MFFTKMNDYQKQKCDTNKNVIKMGVIINEFYCILNLLNKKINLIINKWEEFGVNNFVEGWFSISASHGFFLTTFLFMVVNGNKDNIKA